MPWPLPAVPAARGGSLSPGPLRSSPRRVRRPAPDAARAPARHARGALTDRHHTSDLAGAVVLGLLVLVVTLLAAVAFGSFAAGIVVGGFALIGAGVLIDARDARHGGLRPR